MVSLTLRQRHFADANLIALRAIHLVPEAGGEKSEIQRMIKF